MYTSFLRCAIIMRSFLKIFYLFQMKKSYTKTYFLTKLLQKLPFHPKPKTAQDFEVLLEEARQEKTLHQETWQMLNNVLQVSKIKVRDVMVPHANIAHIEHGASFESILQIVIESGHSRFPVYNENHDEIIGILLAKDLLRFYNEKEKFNIRDILRPPVFIPESKRLDVLLKEFRLKHNHMAVVVDEYGSVAGIVTIEDVLEQIVGRIEDEYDYEDIGTNIKVLNDLQYAVKGATPIKDFNDFFNTDFNDAQFDTIGGLVTHAFAHVPKDGEMVKLDHMLFKVLNADKRKIRLLRVELQKKKSLLKRK